MTPGRKPSKAAEIIDVPMNEALLAADHQALNSLALIELSKQDYTAQRDLANQMLGQIQMSRSFAKFADVVGLSKLQIIKENKIYRAVAGQKAFDGSGNEIADVGTWDGFCAALGTSRQKVDEDLLNLKIFGEEALEQMQRTGIGYRDLRQFRRLAAEQQTELIEAAKAGDTATLLELAEDLIVKHSKDKAESDLELAAKDKRIARHLAKIKEFEDKEDRWHALPVHAQVAESTAEALGLVQGKLRQGFLALQAAHADRGDGSTAELTLAGHLAQLQKLLNDMREEFNLPDVSNAHDAEVIAAAAIWAKPQQS